MNSYAPHDRNYTLFANEKTECTEWWDKNFGSLPCLHDPNKLQKKPNDEKAQEIIQNSPPVPLPSESSKTYKSISKEDSEDKQSPDRKSVHIKIKHLPPVKSITPTPPKKSDDIAVALSSKALIELKSTAKNPKQEEKKTAPNVQDPEKLEEKAERTVQPEKVTPGPGHQLAIKEPCSFTEENFEERELSFKDTVESLTVNEAKKAINIFLQPSLKENLEKIDSASERRKIYIHLIMLCGQAYQDNKDPALAEKLLEVHSNLIDQTVIQNEIAFIQLFYPVVERAIDSFNSDLKCLGLDMLTAYFSFKPKKPGREKDLLEKFLSEDPARASPVIVKKRKHLEEIILQLLPSISYEKIALKMSQAKCALPYLLVWLERFQKDNFKSSPLDEDCFNHLFEFMSDFSKQDLTRVFEALCKVKLNNLKQNEKTFTRFQDIVYNYFSRRFSVQTSTIQEQKDILITFCRNFDKISPQAIFHLKFSLEKLCHSIHTSFPVKTPAPVETMDYWAFSEEVFVPAKPLEKTFLSQNESSQPPSDSLVYFTSIIDTIINLPLPVTENASGVKGKRRAKPAAKVIKKIEGNPNASWIINQIFDHLLSNLPADKEGQKTVFEAIHKLTDEASKQFKFVNSSRQYLLRYIQCYAENHPYLESVLEYKNGVLDPILDYTLLNRNGWETYFKLNEGQIPFEVIKSCVKVIEQDRLKGGLTKEEQNNLLSNLLAMLREIIESKLSNSEKQKMMDCLLQGLIHLSEVDESLKKELEMFFGLSLDIYKGHDFLRLLCLYKLEAFLNKQLISSEVKMLLQAGVKSDDEINALKQVLKSYADEENLMSLKNGLQLIDLYKNAFEGHFVTLVEAYTKLFGSRAKIDKDTSDLLFSWILDEFIHVDSIFSRTGNRNKDVLVQPEDKKMQAEEQSAHREFVDFLINEFISTSQKAINENPIKQKIICQNFLHALMKMAKREYFDIHSLDDSIFLNQIIENLNKFFKQYRIPQVYRTNFMRFCDALRNVIERSDYLAQNKQADQINKKITELGM